MNPTHRNPTNVCEQRYVFEFSDRAGCGPTLDNVVLTPHIASATVATREAMARLVMDNIDAHLAGRTLVTPVPEMGRA